MMRLLLFVLLALPASTLAARNQISGVVTDRNGDPVQQAIVGLVPGNVQLVTDRDGRFNIDYVRDDDGERARLRKRTNYTLEVFRPGFHARSLELYYKGGPVAVDPIALVEETIEVQDHGETLDPELYATPSQSTGATYEGQ
ncbi:MAG: hypothetical protein ACI8PZ_001111 [Myxococcota bacterium]|jgi:hypothetical protein